MKEYIDYLNAIYQNARMGILIIEQVAEKIQSIDFKKEVKAHLEKYERICSKIVDIFVEFNKEEKDLSPFAKLSKTIISKIHLLNKDNDREVAKLIIEQSSKNMLFLMEENRVYSFCEERIKKLGQELLEIEEKQIEQTKKFL